MELLTVGFEVAFSTENLFYCFLGVFLGTFIGVLPGIGPLAAISLLLPVSFQLEPTTALVMLGGVYYGAEYGGSTAAILLNVPGTPANSVTCIDGYPMTKQGRAGPALLITTLTSFVGGSIGIIVLMMLSPMISTVALSFGAAEYFSALVFGLLAAGSVSSGSTLKGIGMVLLGLLLGTVGIDVNSGVSRFTLGFVELFDGLSIMVITIGMFGVSEIIASIEVQRKSGPLGRITLRDMTPTKDDMKRSIFPTLRGAGIGSLFGALPGTGPSIAAFLSYGVERRVARDPSRFGNGAVEGIAAPEAANNAAVQTAFIPTLTLGIPGSATMAVMLGTLMIHGITPGPRLMVEHSELFWGLVASFWIGNLFLLVLNIPLIGVWVSLLRIPYHLLYPVLIAFICIGVYSLHNSVFEVVAVVIFGAFGYLLRLLSFEPAPLVIGFILGPILEENFRRAMLIADGNALLLFTRPISGTLLVAAILFTLVIAFSHMRKMLRSTNGGQEAEQSK